jgi:hypothetical protein
MVQADSQPATTVVTTCDTVFTVDDSATVCEYQAFQTKSNFTGQR